MDDPQRFWAGPLPFVYTAILVLFVREPLNWWLRKSLLRQGRAARIQQSLFNALVKMRIVPPVVLPNIEVEKLIDRPLPKNCSVRIWRPEDSNACLELYRLNAPKRFPSEVEQEFETILEKGDHSLLVIELNGRIAACGGHSQTADQAGLFYGLIHPEFQKQGIGRLLLLSRLARFEVPYAICVQIAAVEASVGYYERFGFARYGFWCSENGEAHPIAGISLHPMHCERIIAFLHREGHAPLPVVKS
jgi:GNAT superfamily N-acetyltransferase